MFLEILIAITTLNVLGCEGKKNQKIKNGINWLYSADLGKLVESYIAIKSNTGIQYKYSKYLKDTKNGNKFYTITTHSGFGKYGKGKIKQEPLMTVFSDKPERKTYKEILPEGLLKIFKNDSHRNIKINANHPNGIINLNKNNGEVVSFPVTFTGCTPPSPNMLIEYLRGDNDKDPFTLDFYNHLDDKTKKNLSGLINNLRQTVRHPQTIEQNLPDFGNKSQLKKKYGKKFMDHILRHCKITFKFMNEKDSSIFEHLMNKKFNKFSNINVFIDSDKCNVWKAIACVSTKIAVAAAVIADAGEEEAFLLAATTIAGKEALSEFVNSIPGLNGNTKFVANLLTDCGLDPTPLCLINPITDYSMGCTCDIF